MREESLTAAIWLTLEGDNDIIPTIITARTATWQSDAAELIAEASLWLASRGAARIELSATPEDADLQSALLEMNFEADECLGTFHRARTCPKRRLNRMLNRAPATPLAAVAK